MAHIWLEDGLGWLYQPIKRLPKMQGGMGEESKCVSKKEQKDKEQNKKSNKVGKEKDTGNLGEEDTSRAYPTLYSSQTPDTKRKSQPDQEDQQHKQQRDHDLVPHTLREFI